MNNFLFDFLMHTNAFTTEEAERLTKLMKVDHVKKNTLIVHEGDYCQECYFVLKGCLRQYIVQDTIEKTIAFFTEEQAVNFFSNTINSSPSKSYLCAVEDSVLLIGNPERDASLFKDFPILIDITTKMMQQDFGNTQDRFAKFISSSPEERYLDVLKHEPHLLQRVPQWQLASYLGMTPESLSRIRKRIAKN